MTAIRDAGGELVTPRFPKRRRRHRPSPNPLGFWRDHLVRPGTFRHDAVVDALATIAMIDEPLWPRAAAGDASTAVGLALEGVVLRDCPAGHRLDLLMSALWRCAVEGDQACVLAYSMLNRRLAAARRDAEGGAAE